MYESAEGQESVVSAGISQSQTLGFDKHVCRSAPEVTITTHRKIDVRQYEACKARGKDSWERGGSARKGRKGRESKIPEAGHIATPSTHRPGKRHKKVIRATSARQGDADEEAS